MKEKMGITVEQLAAGFGRGVSALDEVRARQIAEGLRLESAKGSVHAREHERLRRKYGEQHPRTMEAASRAAASAEYQTRLLVDYGYASTPQPDAGKGWAVDGFVRTPDGGVVRGVTVAACDKQGHWYKELGYACTNEKGYFQLIVAAVPAKEMRVYMRAFEGERMLDSNENRLAPGAGRANRIEIVVDRKGQGDCRPPEPAKGETRPPGPWTVRGRVTNSKGKGLGGLRVSVHDKDSIFDDRLGETKTDPEGNFAFAYRAEDFRDLIAKKPGLYVKVMNPAGKALYSSKRAMQYEAGRTEVIDVVIKEQSKK